MSATRPAPQLLIVLRLEEPPVVISDAATDRDWARLAVWLESSGLAGIVRLAQEAAAREATAP